MAATAAWTARAGSGGDQGQGITARCGCRHSFVSLCVMDTPRRALCGFVLLRERSSAPGWSLVRVASPGGRREPSVGALAGMRAGAPYYHTFGLAAKAFRRGDRAPQTGVLAGTGHSQISVSLWIFPPLDGDFLLQTRRKVPYIMAAVVSAMRRG
jgi:hypothetical protein